MRRLSVLNAYRFEAGEDVPSFLFDFEPLGPGACRPEQFVFQVPCEVFETEGRFVIVPLDFDHIAMKLTNARDVSVGAVSKDIYQAVKVSRYEAQA